MADRELEDLEAGARSESPADVFDKWGTDGLAQTLARFELMIELVRSPQIAQALGDQRARFAAVAANSGTAEGSIFAVREVVALLAGLQFAEIKTGEKVLEKVLSLLLRPPEQ